MKKHILAVALASLAAQAFAADYYLVIPAVKNRAAVDADIKVSLNAIGLPGGLAGRAYAGFDFNSVLQVQGDPNFSSGAVTWSLAGGALPAGLTLNPNGKLSGTPTAGGTSSFQVRAAYRSKSGAQAYQAVVGDISIALADAAVPAGVEGTAYAYDFKPRLSVAGDPAFSLGSVSWSHAGVLPPGLVLNADGTLTGVPTAPGTYPVTINATYLSKTGQRTYQVAVGAITVTLASASLPVAKVDDRYTYDLKAQLSVSGAPDYVAGAGVSWSLAGGSLPTGVTLDTATGVLAGTPTAVGANTFTAKATYKGKAAQQDYAVQVNARGLALQSAGYRTWDDGAVAASCKAYLTSTGKYAYAGATGSGIYRIQPPGWSATNVYCDMTTDGGGWMLAAWNKGASGLANMPVEFLVSPVNAANIANRNMPNASSSINVEGISKALGTRDVMVMSAAYSSTPIIENGQGVWSYDQPDCSGTIGHSGRTAGCANHSGNDNYDTADRFNIAIYPGNTAFVPGWLNQGQELCWSGKGWCDFEFYIR